MDGKMICSLLFIITCANFFNVAARDDTWNLPEEEEIEIDNRLKILNKPYVKTFKDKYGNDYDCVDMYKQPAFDHPLLKNHSDQIRLSLQARQSNATATTKFFSKFGLKECPSGTVLIKRTKKEDLIRAKKIILHFQPINSQDNVPKRTHKATQIFDYSSKNTLYGAIAEMEVSRYNNLNVDQSTSCQVIISKGYNGPKDHFNAIQFGWQIAPGMYGNSDTNLYAFYTADGYETGCFNYQCGSFVQVSKLVTLGLLLPNFLGTINMFATRVVETGDWSLWFKYGNNYDEVGYWPSKLFNNMGDINRIEVGGIASGPVNLPSPPMGNGKAPVFATVGAKIDHIAFRNGAGVYVMPDKSTMSTNVTSFDYFVGHTEFIDNGYKMEYGGPGGFGF